ncbi:hypothetical protein HF288_05640 [Acidithiobacillus caldus]|uniref:pilus assembly protein TadG-related protein n=1 Tax=Acidithiobacillus caldus TaxID=33059 RepID=UPI001C07135A|nr:pilus assembly protein TadG-related protein [Acidithiobacillus caldus]MBU2791000.1 hypothetical protein [Acidithiobacillus caldus]MBU2820807.1 hypothetical protein [Acidithiobacillus caldus]
MANSRSNQQRDGARRRWRFLPHRPRGESGQAAIVAVLLIPAAIAGVLLVFNTGQVTANKLKVQNAADAAAYAAMDLQARQMNLDAYLNRAMLTNQIVIGQAVSVISWSRYLGNAGKHIDEPLAYLRGASYALDAVPPEGVFGNALRLALDGYESIMKGLALTAEGLGIGYGEALLFSANTQDLIYSGASKAFAALLDVATPGGAVQSTVEQLVRLNAGPKARVLAYTATSGAYHLEIGRFVAPWGGSTDGGGNDPGGRARMASMVNERVLGIGGDPNRRDDLAFIRDRGHPVGGFPWKFDIHVDIPLTVRLGAQSSTGKSGGSQLAKDASGNYVWSGADTARTSIDVGSSCKGFLFRRPCWKQLYGDNWAWGGAWSLPGQSQFDYYQGGNRRWSEQYMRGSDPGDAKTLLSRGGIVYQNAWSSDREGMSKVVRDYSGSTPGDFPGYFRGQSKGISEYRDLRWSDNSSRRPRSDLTDSLPRFLVLVDLPVREVRDSATALGINHDPDAKNPHLGWLNMHLDTQGAGKKAGVRAAAAAQVYFRRPAELWPRRIDGLDERANLFSPFWSVRLVDLRPEDRATLLGLNAVE